jgi:hypothetical protein
MASQRTTIGFQDPVTKEVRTVLFDTDGDDPAAAWAQAHTKLMRALVHRTMLADSLSPATKVDLVIEIVESLDTWDVSRYVEAA